MYEYEEIIALALGTFVMTFVFIRRGEVIRVHGYQWLIAALGTLYASFILTVLEGFWPLGGFLNVLEHFSYMASVGFLAFWIWRHLEREEAEA